MFFEMGIVRTFGKVCDGIGGNFIGEGVDLKTTVRESFKDGARFAFGGSWKNDWDSGPMKKKVYPKLFDVQGTKEAWRGLVKPNAGQRLDDYTKNADRFALAFQVRSVTFQLAEKGCIAINAGNVQVPAAYGYED